MSDSEASRPLDPGAKRPQWHEIRLGRIPLPAILLGLIVILAAALRFYNLGAVGEANLYYTAAVKAMLQSWHNFFFAAAEPGGSVSVDKPPLGLWLQVGSAAIFGVNGFAVILPQILAGIISVPILYILVKRYLGPAAGLIAAFGQAAAPVAIAVERDNTMDATLVLFLLLAAWAFIKATESGKLRWLIIGAALVGLGFNTKMMEAFLPLPAFYGLYLLGAKVGWKKKIAHLALATVVLLAVSLAWVEAVDLTPADQRPYVGSSATNSELNLALGYNGINRLVGNGPGGINGLRDGTRASSSGADAGQGNRSGLTPPRGFEPGDAPSATAGNRAETGFRAGGPGGGFGTGAAGPLRLFTAPLGNEISWLLPFGLLSMIVLFIGLKLALPLSGTQQAAMLFGGWLLTEVVFFSVAGFFHPYYLATMSPPLAALVGLGIVAIWRLQLRSRLFAPLLIVAGIGTLGFQVWLASQYAIQAWWLVPAVVLLAVGTVLLAIDILRPLGSGALVGFASLAAAMLVIPALWAGLTALERNPSAGGPSAYSGSRQTFASGSPAGDETRSFGFRAGGSSRAFGGRGTGLGGFRSGPGDIPDGAFDFPGGAPGFGSRTVDQALVSYVQANTQGMRYMMAVSTAAQGEGYVLETGRGVLYMGGFDGRDRVVDVARLQKLVEAGELRFVLAGGTVGFPGGSSGFDGGAGGRSGSVSASINSWLQSSCTVVSGIAAGGSRLYDCAAHS